MPSLFALLHFNTQAHTKLPAEDLMPLLVHFRVGASADWKRMKGDDRAMACAGHTLKGTRVKVERSQIKGSRR